MLYILDLTDSLKHKISGILIKLPWKKSKQGRREHIGFGLSFLKWRVLGTSEKSRYYGIRGRNEAIEYINHPILRDRLVEITEAVYNNEKYLKQCLNSIIHQTLKNIEIICVDDGSDDRSPEILKSFAARDSRIKLLHQENAGAGAARNLGLKHAIGTYLSFLDSDDFFEPDMLELAVEKIESDNADFAVFRCDQYLNDTNQYKSADYAFKKHTLPPYTPFCFREITDNIFKTFVGWAWDKLYRREFVIKKTVEIPGTAYKQ